jgi:carbamoyl-phosphate synthase large subunit
MNLRLLVLSVGTRVGQNVLTSLKDRRDRLHVAATSSVCNEPALFDCDVVYRVPPTAAEPQAFERALLDIMAQERVDLVIPCRDDDVAFLASLRERRPELSSRLLCGSTAPVRVIGDKWLSAQFSVQHGLPFAASLIKCSAEERAGFVATCGFPLVAKPRRGYASLGIYIIWNDAQLAATLDDDAYLAQQFLGDPDTIGKYLAAMEAKGIPLYHTFQGRRHSIQALITPDGAIAYVMSIRIVSDRRRSKWVGLDTDPDAIAIGRKCATVFAAAGWRGPLNIQCQRAPDGKLMIHEFNGRFTGATFERWLLGYDEVGAAITSFTGRPMPSPGSRATPSLEAFETVVGRAADPAHVADLEREGVWRRPG